MGREKMYLYSSNNYTILKYKGYYIILNVTQNNVLESLLGNCNAFTIELNLLFKYLCVRYAFEFKPCNIYLFIY